MTYQPPRALGLLVGTFLVLWPLAAALLLANAGIEADAGFGSFLAYLAAFAMGCLAVLFAYWTYALATLSYAIDRNGLVITWGATRHVVPLGSIERLVPGTSVGVPKVRGISWWGYHVGSAAMPRIGEVLFYSTHQTPEQVLYVMTAERNYAITVQEPARFAREVQTRQDLGPTAEVKHHVERTGPAASGLLHDRRVLVLGGLAVAAWLAMWLHVLVRYADMPQTLALSFPPSQPNDVVDLVDRSAIFELPRVATLFLGVNLVGGLLLYGWERMAGYVLFAAAAALQIAFIVATAAAVA